MKSTHMTKLLALVFTLVSVGPIKGQSKLIDSLKHELAIAREDTDRVKLNNALGYQYFFNEPDISVIYGQRALDLSKKIKFKTGEAQSYFTLWVPMFFKGDYVKALEYAYKQLHLYEDLGDEIKIADSHGSFANIYREQGDLRRAFDHVLIMKSSYEKLGFDNSIILEQVHGNLAAIYEQDNQLDSAIRHAQIVLDHASVGRDWIYWMSEIIGHAYLKKKEYHKAMPYFKKVLPLFLKSGNIKEVLSTKYGVAASFAGMNNIDSALFYARQTYEDRKFSGFIKNLQLITGLLSALYKQKGSIDSSLMFMEISMNFKDSLYSQIKEREIQNFAFEQQLREQQLSEARAKSKRQLLTYGIITAFLGAIIFAYVMWRNNKQKQKANILLQQQKEKVEITLSALKSTQAQLVQSEKMASLGELTAGIAHEIQNPLNFVNNFSEVNVELTDEIIQSINKGSFAEVKELALDIRSNQEKIREHGKRADGIVKSMLLHSRTSTGQKEFKDLNLLADEYLRLSYYGMRAKDKSFNSDFELISDPNLPRVNIIPPDIGRVFLNIINNAFYAVNEKMKASGDDFKPKVTVTLSKSPESGTHGSEAILISISDNGIGIPLHVKEKIFQPFFTTKPTGEGTGLGLSLSYDIITKGHGGEVNVLTFPEQGTTFQIKLPIG